MLTLAGLIETGIGQIPLAEEKVVVSNERRINSHELEFSPVFYKDGIVFISTRHPSLIFNVKDRNAYGQNIMAIYRSRRDGEGFLQEPEPFADELLSRLHEGPVTFDRTAETIFFTRNESVQKAPDGFKKLQVYSAKYDSLVWGSVEKLSFNTPEFNYLHPTISADNDRMFIASDIPGGYGGMDLYVVYKQGDKWLNLINLGESVNTPGNEVFPFIAADGTLYFASDGHGGYGNLDLFYTSETGKDKWGKPVNLGVPFNSPTDDFGFIVDRDNKNGYFSSDRSGGFGADDIYTFYIEGEMGPAVASRPLDGLIVRDENGNPLEGAAVSAIHLDEVSLSAGDDKVVSLVPGDGANDFILDVDSEGMGETDATDARGKADLTLRKKGNYVLKFTKEGYAPQYVVVTPETDLNKLDITMKKAADCVKLAGQVLLAGSAKIPVSGASVQIVNVESREAITVWTDSRGNFEYCLPCKRNFSVYASKNGATTPPAIASTRNIACNASDKIDMQLYLYESPLVAGMTIRLPNIYFNFDDAALRPDAYKDLNEVVGMLKNYPGMKLELASHTDARGSKEYNLDLSHRRSVSVYEYLVKNGVEKNRLVAFGYGESQIKNRCTDGIACPEAEHQENRRTEVKIIEVGKLVPEYTPSVAGTSPQVEEDDLSTTTEEGDAESGKGGQELLGGKPEAIRVKESTETTGTFAVVAGTFANHDYAVRRANLLGELGFDETEIVKQDRNGLYAVWVKTFNDKNQAFAMVKQLAQQQLHAYVFKK
jgi:outer membrane protein OmpA-like peptidoglycan-associated protein